MRHLMKNSDSRVSTSIRCNKQTIFDGHHLHNLQFRKRKTLIQVHGGIKWKDKLIKNSILSNKKEHNSNSYKTQMNRIIMQPANMPMATVEMVPVQLITKILIMEIIIINSMPWKTTTLLMKLTQLQLS